MEEDKTPEEMEQEVQETEKLQESEIPGKLETQDESQTEMEEPVEKDIEKMEETENKDDSEEESSEDTEEVSEDETEEEPTEESGEEEKEQEQPEEEVSEKPAEKKEATEEKPEEAPKGTKIYALRTTANREDQVMDFVGSNAAKKKLEVYTIIRPHGMRGYIFLEAATKSDAEQAAFGVPYARGILPKEIDFSEIEHMLEQGKKEVNIQKNDICEIISGPFKREKAKITRIDKQKEEVVVELLEAAVPIPITVKMDSVKVIRRDNPQEEE